MDLNIKVTLSVAHDPNLEVALTLVLAKAVLTLICHHGCLPVL